MTTFASRAAARCVLLATTSLAALALAAAPAFAQALPETAPPARYQVDENGVDLARGTFKLTAAEIAIGPDGPGGLALVRERGVSIDRHNYQLGLYDNGGGRWSAGLGLVSHEFTLSGGVFTASDGSGAKLLDNGNGSWTLTAADGTIVQYDLYPTGTIKARGSSITWPSGDRVTIAWAATTYCVAPGPGGNCYGALAVRLQSVSSSSGYRLHFGYGAATIPDYGSPALWQRLDRVVALNTVGSSACQPMAHACAPPPNSAVVSYALVSGETQVTDPIGRVTRYESTPQGFTVRRPSSPSTPNLTAASSGGAVSSVIRDGMSWDYDYSVSGDVATMVVTDPLGHERTIVSDLDVGLPTSIENELGHVTSYAYDGAGRLKKVTMPEGNSVEYDHDSRGNVTTTRANAKLSSPLADIVTTAAYPASCTNILTCNQPTSTTDARGEITFYSYSPFHGELTAVTWPASVDGGTRPQARYTWSALSAPDGPDIWRLTATSTCQTQSSCAGEADEVKTQTHYDDPNRLPSVVETGAGDGSLTSAVGVAYDTRGNPVTVNGPLAGSADVTRHRYDLADQRIGAIAPDPDGAGPLKHRARRLTYNADGQVIRIEAGTTDSSTAAIDIRTEFTPLEYAETAYDAAGRPSEQRLKDALGTVHTLTQLSYDGEGRLECSAVRMNPAAFASLPSSVCDMGTQGAFGPDRIAKTFYDAADQATHAQSGRHTPEMRIETMSYARNGRLSTVTDAEGNMTAYEYDGHDRLRQTIYPHPDVDGKSNFDDFEELTYEPGSSLIVSRRLRDGQVIAYGYDDLSRLRTKNLPGSEPDVTYGYDLLGRMTSATQTGHSLTFAYDALDRQLTETGPNGTVASEYDLAGRRTKLTHPDGFYVTHDHLVTGEIAAIREYGATSGPGVLATYAHDGLGRRTSLTRGNGTVTAYAYDPVSRLSQMTTNLGGTAQDVTFAFSHNPAGQIASTTRYNDAYSWTGHGNGTTASTVNGLNQLTAHGGTTVVHDARGNLTSDGAGGSYAYSSENLLTAAGTFALAYDPLMRLWQIDSAATAAVRSVYDGLDRIADYDSAGTLQHRYVYGPGIDEPIAWYVGPSIAGRRYLHADERGSIIAVTDSAGAMMAINTYDEYGKLAPTNIGRFQYTGQAWLPEVKLYYYKNRMYDPDLPRFLQTDPIGYAGGMNGYIYANADPINLADPLGLAAMCTGTRLDCPTSRSGGGLTVGASGYSYNYHSPSATERREAREAAAASAAASSGSASQSVPSGSSRFSVPVYTDEEGTVVVTASTMIPDDRRWVFSGDRFYLNPNYVPPWFDVGLEGFIAIPPLLGAGAAFVVSAPAAGEALFVGNRLGLLNRNPYFRIGWGPGREATRQNYYEQFRIVIGNSRSRVHEHVDIPGLTR